MFTEDTPAGAVYRSRILDAVPNVVHGFGVRGVGVEKYLSAFGIVCSHLFETDQIHGSRVHHLRPDGEKDVRLGDAFMTDESHVVCFVRTADCVPILIADPVRRAVAAVHAGWRGTGLDVPGETVRAMKRQFGTNPADCVAAIGPRICGKCYEVGGEVIGSLAALKIGESWKKSERYVDLGDANRSLLKRAGIPEDSISVLPCCTSCDRTFASWRRDRDRDERQFNFIVMIRRQPQDNGE